MKVVCLVTGNSEKLRVARQAVKGSKIELENVSIETPEIQSFDGRKIAEYSASYAANKLGKPVLKTDACWEMIGLNGFPGAFAKFTNKWLKSEDYLVLLNESKDRSVKVTEYLAYCEPGKSPVCFTGIAKGSIAEEAKGCRGTVLDKIFVPDGFKCTAAELSEQQMAEFWAKSFNHWADFLSYIESPDSLCFRALKGKLPDNQLMDLTTVDWIRRKTNPALDKAVLPQSFVPVSWREIAKFIPSKSDYFLSHSSNSIHGIMHSVRVLIYSGILCEMQNADKESVFLAAKFHDTCRLNDGEDKGHGKMASTKVDNELAKEIISEHDTGNASNIAEVNLFRMADALDRFRLPNEAWFPDSKFLDNSAKSLLESAKYLVWKTELLSVQGVPPERAVKQVAIELGMVLDD